MHATYSLGLDFGTSSVRALVVRLADGAEIGAGQGPYAHGTGGVIGDPRDPNFARQDPRDYFDSLVTAVTAAVEEAREDAEFVTGRIVGIGIDSTASTPIPVDDEMLPLAARPEWEDHPDALAWLWKDHTAHAEAARITARALELRPEYLTKCGGTYSSEWYWAKLLHALERAPEVLAATAGWIEQGDYIAARLTGVSRVENVTVNSCAAGHKALYHSLWGFPDEDFLRAVDPRLGDWTRRHPLPRPRPAGTQVGGLAADWAQRLALEPGIPVSAAAIDAHVGAVGAGVRPGVLVKILGTSGCDMAVHPAAEPLGDIPGLCGIAEESILPGHWGLEAGQSALGDLFGWFERQFGAPAGLTHAELTRRADRFRPGETGLLALDWNNGNRTVLADPRLTGLLVGQTLLTPPEAIYRALIEATGFGARVILDRFEEFGVPIEEIVVCGGIAEKSPFLLQTYADITGRAIAVSRSRQTCALGAAIFGAVAGGTDRGGHASVEAAQRAMTGRKPEVYRPRTDANSVYSELYRLYRRLHDAFGGVTSGNASTKNDGLGSVMKDLIRLREESTAPR